MLFTEGSFLVLVLITFGIFYFRPLRKLQSWILIGASCVFYAYSEFYLLLLLLSSILINSISSYLVEVSDKNIKLYSWSGVGFNLATLIFFKYSGLLAGSFSSDKELVENLLLIPLPVGISFYTFQGISLVIDVYKEKQIGNSKNEIVNKNFSRHFTNSFLFISFFPQLVAGPILKPEYFLKQISLKRWSDIQWQKVAENLILGYFFKMVIADNLKEFTAFLELPFTDNFSAFTMIMLLYGYSIQIFADFAGYSFIAIGLGYLFGYELIRNFEYPYIAKSFSEFWNRWHISLYHWFNEYVFNPVNFKLRYWGKWAVMIGLFVTFSLSGIWHGASWNFAIWGMFHAIALILEFRFGKKLRWKKWPNGLKTAIVFSYITFSYLIFKIESHLDLWEMILHFFSNLHFKISIWNYEWYVFLYCLPVVFYHMNFLLLGKDHKVMLKVKPLLYALMLILLFNNAGSQSDFIYFRF